MLDYILLFLIILSAIPVGYFLAKSTKEELKSGRRGFLVLVLCCFLVLVFIIWIKAEIIVKNSIILSLLFIVIVCLISYMLSYKKKFLKN